MRELSVIEQGAVSGGLDEPDPHDFNCWHLDGSDDCDDYRAALEAWDWHVNGTLVINGERQEYNYYDYYDQPTGGSRFDGGYEDSDDDEADSGGDPPEQCLPFAEISNVLSAPTDGATYFTPENFSMSTLIDAASQLRAFADGVALGGGPSYTALLSTFASLYIESVPSFNGIDVDFKTQTNQTYEYFSVSTNALERANIFEALGNFGYGFIGVLAGIREEDLANGAALFQQGGTLPPGVDDPRDAPHIQAGIQAARDFMASGALPDLIETTPAVPCVVI